MYKYVVISLSFIEHFFLGILESIHGNLMFKIKFYWIHETEKPKYLCNHRNFFGIITLSQCLFTLYIFVLPGPYKLVLKNIKETKVLQSLPISIFYSPIGGQFLLYPITVLGTKGSQVFPDSLGILLEDFTQTSLVGRTLDHIHLLVWSLRTHKIKITHPPFFFLQN